MHTSFIFISLLFDVTNGIVPFDRSDLGISTILNYSIPWNTTHVNFEHNVISHVYANYFKNLSELIYISFYDNLISDIDDYSFVAVPTVMEINLSRNRLSLIRRHMFSGLNNLETLHFSGYTNYIHTIQSYSFIENTAMKKLNLQYNAISVVTKPMLAGLVNLRELQLRKKQVRAIEPNSLEDNKVLMKLQLGYNALSLITKSMFSGHVKIEKMEFSQCKISHIEDYGFSEAPNVKEISLQNNRLTIIRRNMFAGIAKLQVLVLANNRLQEIELESLRENTGLIHLKLENNFLETLEQSVFNPEHHPKKINYFRISNNPLSCDQSLCWLKHANGDWIGMLSTEATICAGPVSRRGETWKTLTTLQVCNPPGDQWTQMEQIYYSDNVEIAEQFTKLQTTSIEACSVECMMAACTGFYFNSLGTSLDDGGECYLLLNQTDTTTNNKTYMYYYKL